MRAMVITTGEEILKGEVVDSHAAWISEQLCELGVEVVRHLSVGDNLSALKEVFSRVAGRCDVAVVTGGLGPTEDDLTTRAAAESAGVPLVEDPVASASVAAYFEGRKAPVPASNLKQARLPKGAACIPNPVGTAPAFSLELSGTRFWFLPGVPREMRFLMTESVTPAISGMQPKGSRLVKTAITTFGLPESVVGERISGIEAGFPGVHVGYRASFPVIEVKIWAFAGADAGLAQRQEAASAEALKRLDGYVVSEAGLSMPEAVAASLKGAGKTLAVAESCTGGLIGNLLTDVPGSSDWFFLSAVTYANSAKEKVLGVSGHTLETWGAVSAETVAEMAEGARRVSGADIGVATSGIAGPSGGTDEKPVGTVWIGVATEAGTETHRFVSPFKDRHMNKRVFAFKALDLVRRTLK
ncbi:CinA family nicotinamide mononucleotide deamidase-related protein [Desulfoluna butyratoxydans]|uniref:CinA-like protein n=1 Tax=Desulfoluna butyratoxydans TaxID=231438 RepID=A0A4U8YYD6_9BACT|nr:CinA family nicotinamide mononucleotide deamidase-related protein [Desulfoluna butyratoxydans]VFQ46533.1 competence-induced protein cina [Desulfoluna butyratoxydans]